MKKIIFLLCVSLLGFGQDAHYNGWLLNGNTPGTNSNWLGTRDVNSLIFKTNNTTAFTIGSTGTGTFVGAWRGTGSFSLDLSGGVNSISPKKFSYQPWTFNNTYGALYASQNIPNSTNFFLISDSTLNKVGAPQTLYLGQGGGNGLQIQLLENNGNTGTTLAASGHYFFTSGPATNTVNANQHIPLVVFPALTYSLGGGIVPNLYAIEAIAPNIKATTATTVTEASYYNAPDFTFGAGITVNRKFGYTTPLDVTFGRGIVGLTATVPTATWDVRGNLNVTSTGTIGAGLTTNGITNNGSVITPSVFGSSAVSGNLFIGSTTDPTKGTITLGASTGSVLVPATFSLQGANLSGGNTGTVAVLSDAVFAITSGWASANPAISTTYPIMENMLFNANGNGKGRVVLPFNCTFIGYSYTEFNLTTPASAETATLMIRQNATTTTTLSTTISFSGNPTKTSDFTQSINFAVGDDFDWQIKTPAWLTPPLSADLILVAYFVRRK